ncbi:alpha-galactosidase [Microbacterium sp. NPDC060132]|nr:alpha-galactosidase [Microbacterium sp. PF5]
MSSQVLLLRSAGVALIVDCRHQRARVVHWGPDLGALDDRALLALCDAAVPARLNATPDDPLLFGVLPTEDDAWTGRPAVVLSRSGIATTPRPRLISANIEDAAARLVLRDEASLAEITLELALDPHGVLEHRRTVRNIGQEALTVDGLDAVLPLPVRADEILDFTGAWIGERMPQRHPVSFAVHAREHRRGRPGHDAAFVTLVGTAGFTNRRGELWAMHVAWSGDHGSYVERSADGAGDLSVALSGGELLRRGEVILDPGTSYSAPAVLFTWSDAGIDGISDRFHDRLRARPQHPQTPRPLVLSTWEAVYLDHDVSTLRSLAERAADVGVERFVLDDGWFRGRTTDTAGLGDWYVDEGFWPEGLHPLVDLVRSLGMQFGLWVEPEMVNLDSDVARKHPEWLLTPADGWPSRAQYVLDVAQPAVYDYLLERLDALISEYRIDFLKWDHNRDLLEAPSHTQTRAVYALMDALRQRHPQLEIESCASGGARVDLGILQRTDRVWPSDTLDPLERERIQRWTSLLLPLELIGSHIGAATAHTTGRRINGTLPLITALFAHAGIEMNLLKVNEAERDALTQFAELYRETRALIASGRLVNADVFDPAARLFGVVSPDRSRALFAVVQIGMTAGRPARVQIPGLDESAGYDVRVRSELGVPDRGMSTGPAWFDAALNAPLRLAGSMLARSGLSLPPLRPETAALIELTRVTEETSDDH